MLVRGVTDRPDKVVLWRHQRHLTSLASTKVMARCEFRAVNSAHRRWRLQVNGAIARDSSGNNFTRSSPAVCLFDLAAGRSPRHHPLTPHTTPRPISSPCVPVSRGPPVDEIDGLLVGRAWFHRHKTNITFWGVWKRKEGIFSFFFFCGVVVLFLKGQEVKPVSCTVNDDSNELWGRLEGLGRHKMRAGSDGGGWADFLTRSGWGWLLNSGQMHVQSSRLARNRALLTRRNKCNAT